MEKENQKIYDSMRAAIMIGDRDSLKKLLSEGADPNMSSDSGWSIMHAAAIYNDDCIDMLIAAGADPCKADDNGWTILHQAVTGCIKPCVKILLPFYIKEGKIDIKDKYGRTPLHCSAFNGRKETFDMLLDAGADIECEDNTGKTALHLAVENNSTEIALNLIEAGADIEHKNRQGDTPFYVSICRNSSRCTSALIQSGADVFAAARYGDKWNCLHRAAEHGKTGLMRKLIKAGVDLEETDLKGRAPLDILKEKYPERHKKYAKGIYKLFEKTRNARLKKEDRRKVTDTGFEFDI